MLAGRRPFDRPPNPRTRRGPTPKRRNWKPIAVVGAAAVAVMMGLGVGLFLFRGPGDTRTGAGQQSDANALPACNSETPATLLDESRIPASGPALEAALKDSVALFFSCQELPIDRFARTFATLSIVIAQYARERDCFRDDAEAASLQWSAHKAWADRQGRADLLMENLRRKIASALACLPPDQRPLLFVDFARAFTFAAAAQTMQTFVDPVFRGQRVDRCLYHARDCDEPAALAWCSQYGYNRLTKWEWVRVPQAVALGDQKACDSSCGAFATIVCAQ